MTSRHTPRPVFALIFLFIQLSCCLNVKKFPLTLPHVRPYKDDLYLCTSVKVVPDKSFYIVGFEPNASMSTVHHMLVFGCKNPGTMDEVWDCGEMANDVSSDLYRNAKPCDEWSNIIYAWGLDAETLTLPEGVGFQIGKNSDIAYLVLQMHYLKEFPLDKYDSSGTNLIYTEEPQSKLAAVAILATGGSIPPHSITYMETACRMPQDREMFPISYRVHTHALGQTVSGYSVHRDKTGKDHWRLLGKRDPHKPQMFYPTFSEEPIPPGDKLAARCTMNSRNRSRLTTVGPSHSDEMCNFYLMFYVEGGQPLSMDYCLTQGPPFYYWKDEFNSIPHYEASAILDD